MKNEIVEKWIILLRYQANAGKRGFYTDREMKCILKIVPMMGLKSYELVSLAQVMEIPELVEVK